LAFSASISAQRSATKASGRRRPRLFQELVLQPQPAILLLQLLHPGTLHRGQLGLEFRISIPPRFHPIAQRPIIDTQITGDLRDRLTGLDHQLNRLSLELRAEPPATL
jgi:hypothetical protein